MCCPRVMAVRLRWRRSKAKAVRLMSPKSWCGSLAERVSCYRPPVSAGGVRWARQSASTVSCALLRCRCLALNIAFDEEAMHSTPAWHSTQIPNDLRERHGSHRRIQGLTNWSSGVSIARSIGLCGASIVAVAKWLVHRIAVIIR